MELHFYLDEMRDFLKKRDYDIVIINTWENRNVYHNDVETCYVKVECAVKKGEKLPLDEQGEMCKHQAQNDYSLKTKFEQELRKTLLAL